MAIKVRLAGGSKYNVWKDLDNGISVCGKGVDTESSDLTGYDCRNVIKAIGMGILELSEGYLGPVSINGTVPGAPVTIDCVTAANFKPSKLVVTNTGTGTFYLKINSDPNDGILIPSGGVVTIDSPIPISSITISQGSAPATYSIYMI